MLQGVAEKMIKSGHAYIDDTPVCGSSSSRLHAFNMQKQY